MFKSQRGLALFLKLGRAILEDEKEESEEVETLKTGETEAKPMQLYWESDKQNLNKKKLPFFDLFLKDVGQEKIPDTTEEPVTESHYDYDKLSRVFLPQLSNLNEKLKESLKVTTSSIPDVTEVPKTGTGISSSGRDAGVVAGIVVAVISGVIILAALIAVVMYRHYVHRNVTSMNFDNPVYRKTTEDQFALEKNGYAPGSKLYPSTVGEEAQEPLNTPGTNDFV